MDPSGTQGSARSSWHVSSGDCAPDTVDRLLRLLPEWFGIEAAIVEYVERARKLPAYVAWACSRSSADADGGEEREAVGVLLAERHFPGSAEVCLMAVDPTMHHHGIGRSLLQALEADLIADGVGLLGVKTLGPSRPDAHYERTREFYAGMGFRPLEEIHGLWPDNPCLVMVKVLD
jgi:GNAT superfamily N-acetyltransferase